MSLITLFLGSCPYLGLTRPPSVFTDLTPADSRLRRLPRLPDLSPFLDGSLSTGLKLFFFYLWSWALMLFWVCWYRLSTLMEEISFGWEKFGLGDLDANLFSCCFLYREYFFRKSWIFLWCSGDKIRSLMRIDTGFSSPTASSVSMSASSSSPISFSAASSG